MVQAGNVYANGAKEWSLSQNGGKTGDIRSLLKLHLDSVNRKCEVGAHSLTWLLSAKGGPLLFPFLNFRLNMNVPPPPL